MTINSNKLEVSVINNAISQTVASFAVDETNNTNVSQTTLPQTTTNSKNTHSESSEVAKNFDSIKKVHNDELPNCDSVEGDFDSKQPQYNSTRSKNMVMCKSDRLIKRHQSCPNASTMDSKQIKPPPRGQTKKSQTANNTAYLLPVIDNCDSHNLQQPAISPIMRHNSPTIAENKQIHSRIPKQHTSTHRTVVSPMKEDINEFVNATRTVEAQDWKAKLNHELTLYQQFLQHQQNYLSFLNDYESYQDSKRQNDDYAQYEITSQNSDQSKKLQIKNNNTSNEQSNTHENVITCKNNSVKIVTPYSQFLHAMKYDKLLQKEISFGRRVGFYRFKGDIGNGNFSRVKIAVHSLIKEKVAIKILDKTRLDSKTQKMLIREIRTMETLHHPNLIRIFEVIETLNKHFIIMELAPGGELFQVINKHGRFHEKEAQFYFSQIVSAIEHMHQHNIIHRDIKAENVFFANPFTIKVGDFGFSTRIASQDELLSTFCGSPPYAAPELFRDESYLGPSVDYWALGVLLHFIVTGTMPFRAQTIVNLKKQIIECRYDIPAYVSLECCQLINGFLQSSPSKRFNLEQARQCRWLRNQATIRSVPKYDLRSSYMKLLQQRKQAEKRNSLSEIPIIDQKLVNRLSAPDVAQLSESLDGVALPKSAPVQNGVFNVKARPLLSECEKRSLRELLLLGIGDHVIVENLDKGSLSPIVGIYRIVLNRYLNEALKRSSATIRNGDKPNDESVNRAKLISRCASNAAAKAAIFDLQNEKENVEISDSFKSKSKPSQNKNKNSVLNYKKQ